MCFIANSWEVEDAKDDFDSELEEVDLASVEQPREEGYWGSIDWFRRL
jgi:hypothetical protein